MRLLIPYGGPPALEQTSLHLVEQQAQGKLDSEHLHRAIQALAHNYSTGGYLTPAEKQQIHSKTKGLSICISDTLSTHRNFPQGGGTAETSH